MRRHPNNACQPQAAGVEEHHEQLASLDRPARCDDASRAPGQESNMAIHEKAPVSKPVPDDAGADRGTIEPGGPGRICVPAR